jgi:hypothetical protein
MKESKARLERMLWCFLAAAACLASGEARAICSSGSACYLNVQPIDVCPSPTSTQAANLSFTGSISGTTLTLGSAASGTGTLAAGQMITGQGIPGLTFITTLASGTLGTKGSTYTVNNSASVSNIAITATNTVTSVPLNANPSGCAAFNANSPTNSTPPSYPTNWIGFTETGTTDLNCPPTTGSCKGHEVTEDVWTKAGINIAWLPMVYYNNATYQEINDITLNASGTNYTSVLFQTLTQQTPTGSACGGATPIPPLNPSPLVLNMFFVSSLTPMSTSTSETLESAGSAIYGLGWVGCNGMAISAATFPTGKNPVLRTDVLAHEIAHNCGLNHADTYNPIPSGSTNPPSLDLVTAGNDRTSPSSVSAAFAALNASSQSSQADQIDTSSGSDAVTGAPWDGSAGTTGQVNECMSSSFAQTTKASNTTVSDPAGSDLVTFNTSLSGNGPNVTLIELTVTLDQDLQADPAHTPTFTTNTADNYVSSSVLYTGSASNPLCSGGGTTCLVTMFNKAPPGPGLPSTAGNLIFTWGIKNSPLLPPGGTALSHICITYLFSNGQMPTSCVTQSGTSGTASSTSPTPTSQQQSNSGLFQTYAQTNLNGSKPCALGTETSETLPNGCPVPLLADADPSQQPGSLPASPATFNSCLPAVSMSAMMQSTNNTVTAYVPNAAWTTYGTTGLQVVPIEPASPVAAPSSISIPNYVNSCASNSSTGQTVCTGNSPDTSNHDVYLLSGTSLTGTLRSGSTGSASFNGGSCQTCSVAINPSTNMAALSMALGGDPSLNPTSGTGLQFLDLNHNTFSSPIPAYNYISVQPSWDPTLNLILSPNEAGVYDLFNTSALPSSIPSGMPTVSAPEFASTPLIMGGPPGYLGSGSYSPQQFESAAEDCTTGISVALGDYYGYLHLANLSQANFNSGSPGSWSAPQQYVYLPEFAQNYEGGYPAENNVIVVAPGSHLAVVTGDFGINTFGVVLLPSTSGETPPNVVDYVAAVLPNTPDQCPWSSGLDPHTVTGYVSPNSHKAYALMASAPVGSPSYLAVVDMAALLAAPRYNNGFGPNNVCQVGQTDSCPDGSPPVDLVASGIVRYVATGNPTCTIE